jgi:hypothetical protein
MQRSARLQRLPADKDDYVTPKCDHDPRGQCVFEYIAELWSVDGAPRMVWRVRPDGKRPPLFRGWPYPKAASGPIVFTYYERCQARPAWQRTLGLYAERLGVSVDDIR